MKVVSSGFLDLHVTPITCKGKVRIQCTRFSVQWTLRGFPFAISAFHAHSSGLLYASQGGQSPFTPCSQTESTFAWKLQEQLRLQFSYNNGNPNLWWVKQDKCISISLKGPNEYGSSASGSDQGSRLFSCHFTIHMIQHGESPRPHSSQREGEREKAKTLFFPVRIWPEVALTTWLTFDWSEM